MSMKRSIVIAKTKSSLEGQQWVCAELPQSQVWGSWAQQQLFPGSPARARDMPGTHPGHAPDTQSMQMGSGVACLGTRTPRI